MDLRELLGVEGRAAELVGLLSAATAELVELLADVLVRDGWHGYGIRSPEHWVALRFGLSAAHAGRLVAAARGLQDLPQVREAFAAGEITEDHVGAIVRAGVTTTHDDQVVELARHATVSQLRKGLSFLPKPPAAAPVDELEPPAPAPAASRPQLAFGWGDDGMWWISGRFAPEDGSLIEKALVAGRDAEFRARYGDDVEPTERDEISWADAMVRMAHAALDDVDPDATAGRPPGDRVQVIVHLNPDTDTARFHLGPNLDRLSRRHLCCDAMIRFAATTQAGNVNLGRRQRVVNSRLRTVVEHRDGGCAVPGCSATRWLTIHHIVHWEDGGLTNTDNLIALCTAHHRAVHHGEFTIHGNPDQPATLQFIDARGQPIGLRPPRPPGRPAREAAADLGITGARYRTRSGERADWNMLWWRDHPQPVPA